MNIEVKTSLDIEDVADYLANGNADQQAEFFNVFFKSMKMACETSYKFDMQKTYISEKLDDNAKDSVKFLGWEEGDS